ncbi:multiple C2 and transmembrane domain-containing protein 1-like isoform X1 [Dermacentor variabilis]|uniref:multiple C2 and transmembrane domain-containing protein 1-like isoform X1 n=1 Tax=Dermacentor variabilis TaxID=34621 RepID=UPI003F5B3BEB
MICCRRKERRRAVRRESSSGDEDGCGGDSGTMSPARASSSEGQRPASSPPDIAQQQQRRQQPTSPRRRAGAATKRIACAVSTTFRKLGHRLHRHHKASSSAVGGASSSYASAAPGTGNSLQYSGRLSRSHPDVSSSDLVGLARGDSVASTPCQRPVPGGCRDQASYSDPTLLRSRRRLRQQQQGVSVDEDTSLDVTATAPALLQTAPPAPATPPASFARGVLAAAEGGEEVFPCKTRKTESSSGVVLYKLEVHLRCGKNLVAKDACGTSDPYVKFKQGGRQVYRSRTVSRSLDPYWDECFTVAVRDLWDPLVVRVFDYDFGLQDDFMGAATVELHTLEIDRPTDILLNLTESGKAEDADAKDLGYIVLTVTLLPASARDDVEQQYFSKSLRLGSGGGDASSASASKKQKVQLWDSVINVVLVEGRNLLAMDDNGFSDPYVRFRLGTEKYKSKNVIKTLNPQWLEQFDLHMYTDQPKVLEISVWDKDFSGKGDFMGRCSIDLSSLEPETTHSVWQPLEDGAGSLFLLLTISGSTQGTSCVSDLTTFEATGGSCARNKAMRARYGLLHSFYDWDDVGHLVVKVYKAQGLASADLGGKSDPFCVLELVNSRLQTHTEYKTLSPEWNKIFCFKVKDIHSVLELTVYDEDRDKKCEFLGKLAIPLLKIKNGEKKWYGLKDRKLKTRVKGQIFLEMSVVYNPIKACVKTFNPKETKFMQLDPKFKRIVFMRNLTRVKNIVVFVIDMGKFLNNCFLWESVPRSLLAFFSFMVITYTAELYMLPLVLLLVFFKNLLVLTVAGIQGAGREEEDFNEEDEDDDDEDKDSKTEEKKSLKERLQAVQEATATVQNVLGEVASLGERINNTFNFSVPQLSWLAIIVLLLVTCILYYVPIRYVVMAWGINKFTKKLRSPDVVPNNEVMDFLSRVPDNEEKVMYRELRPAPSAALEAERKKKKKIS